MRFRRMITVGTSVVALSAMTAGPALAHYCLNASRSAQGNHRAGTQSQAWYEISIADEFVWELDDAGIEDPDGAIATCSYDYWLDHGGLPSFTIMVKGANGSGGVLGANNPNHERLHDGRGIDHLDFAMFALFDDAIEHCLTDD